MMNGLKFLSPVCVSKNRCFTRIGHLLGIRPNGFISFRYDLTPYLYFGVQKNVIAVKMDNSR